MKTYKCIVMRTQYQTVEVKAKDYNDAENKAKAMFDYDAPCEEYIEVYDLVEIKGKK